MQKLIRKIIEFRTARDWDQYHSPKNLALALMVEAAELAEHFQWLTQEESYEVAESKCEAIKDEIGDILI
jgi:NTP pyrophosphatase (non-canonical NTP hydrolase)